MHSVHRLRMTPLLTGLLVVVIELVMHGKP